tara:strand:- start:74 stop:541 length:468 start_codon:yes stop_codon:yes gene_type:complete
MDERQSEALGIFYCCGKATHHLLNDGTSYHTWQIEGGSKILLRFQMLYSTVSDSVFVRSKNTLITRCPKIKRRFYQAFYDEYGSKILPKHIVNASPAVSRGFVRGAMATRHGTELKLVVHQSVFKDFYTLMKQSSTQFHSETCDFDNDFFDVRIQ